MQTLYIAFTYDTPMCPPRKDDPRKYGAGTCRGAFLTLINARVAVQENCTNRTRTYVEANWWRLHGDRFYAEGYAEGDESTVYYGYIIEVPLDRREALTDRRGS